VTYARLKYESTVRVELGVDSILEVRAPFSARQLKLNKNTTQRLPSADERKLEKELGKWVCLSVVAKTQRMNSATE